MKDLELLLFRLNSDLSTVGEKIAPEKLLELLETIEDPISALLNQEQSNLLFHSIEGDLGFLYLQNRMNLNPSADQFERAVAILRWLLQELNSWASSDDKTNRRLVALLVTACCFDRAGGLWQKLEKDKIVNQELFFGLAVLLSRIKFSTTARGFNPEPIRTQEVIDVFIEAEKSENWEALSEHWKSFEYALFQDVLLCQITRCLFYFKIEELISGASSLRQILVCAQIAESIGIKDRLILANRSENNYLQFACAYTALNSRIAVRNLDDDETNELAKLFLTVARKDDALWKSWMQVFNKFPSRYPAIQRSLGKALAHVAPCQLDAYIDAFLFLEDSGRVCDVVGGCLQEFLSNAVVDQRLLLLSSAYRRWASWRFGIDEENKHLFDIKRSLLDHLIVKYIWDFMSSDELNSTIQSIFGQIECIADVWHQSRSDLTTSYYRLVSMLQPFAFARETAEGDCNIRETTYMPELFEYAEYFKMMISVG